jgi:hypothetical protein
MLSKKVMLSFALLTALAAMIVAGSETPRALAQVIERNPSRTDRHPGHAKYADPTDKRCRASNLIGMKVRGLDGEESIGSINDLVIGLDGDVDYVAVSFGGFLGMGDKLFAVPFDAIDWVKTDDDTYARIDVTEKTLNQKKGFNQDAWPSEADRSFTNSSLRRQAAR